MIRLILAFLLLPVLLIAQSPDRWRTEYERSGYLRTGRYAETVQYCQRLAQASPWVRYERFGKTPQGRDLPLVILSRDGAFTPEAARRSGKAIVMIQSGIHAGEIDGKDASLILMREIAITKERAAVLDHAVILVIPIFNVDGHERFGPYNRINQNGPEEMGWRVTAQNLNLNRDYMKADAPEMQAWLKLFNAWMPDFFVDCHVTDGIDFQYDVTFEMEPYPNADRVLAGWYERTYIPRMIADVQTAGHLIAPYVVAREDNDLSKGLVYSASGPRLSTGYCAKQNRPALLIETHMLKPYRQRVSATHDILVSTLSFVNENVTSLHRVIADVDARAKAMADAPDRPFLPLRYELTPAFHLVPFKGVVTRFEPSEISGAVRRIYTPEPQDTVIPYFDVFRVTDSVRLPAAYAIPQEWTAVIERLRWHGIRMLRLSRDTDMEVSAYRLKDPKWQERPFEGRHAVRFTPEVLHERHHLPAGTVIVPTDQRRAVLLAGLLEPSAPDALVGWGFFDAIFEQKEYGESYVLETLAREMTAKDPALKKAFDAKVASDTVFAKNPYARLNFFYQRSPYWDATLGMYPVVRIEDRTAVRSLPAH